MGGSLRGSADEFMCARVAGNLRWVTGELELYHPGEGNGRFKKHKLSRAERLGRGVVG